MSVNDGKRLIRRLNIFFQNEFIGLNESKANRLIKMIAAVHMALGVQ
jgi:hypothetical protein